MATIRDRYVLNVDTGPAVKSINNVRSALGAIGGALAVGTIVQATRGITSAVTAYERLQTVLTTYLGSQARANRELERLQQLALGLPQDLQDISEAFVIFTRYGLGTTNEALTEFSNIATASGRSLTQLAEALGDAQTGEFERLKEFGIVVRREAGQIVAFMGQQQVAVGRTGREIAQQLQSLGSTRFAGAAAANSDTLSQSMSNLRGTIWQTTVAFGQGLVPALKDANDGLSEMLQNNRELIEEMGVNLGQALYNVGEGIAFLIRNIDVLTVALSTIVGIKVVGMFAEMLRYITQFAVAATSGAASLTRLGSSIAGMVRSIPGVGLLARAFTVLLGPIGWAVTAVTGLYVLFQKFKDQTVQLGDTTSTWGELTFAVLSRIRDAFSSFFGMIGDGFDQVGIYVKGFRALFAGVLGDIFSNMGDNINSFIGMWVGLFQTISNGITAIPAMFSQALAATGTIILEWNIRIARQFGELWDFIASRGEDEIRNTFTGMADVITNELAKIQGAEAVDWDTVLNTDYLGVVQNKIGEVGEGLVLAYRDANQVAEQHGAILSEIAIQAAVTVNNARERAVQQAAITQAVESERTAQQEVLNSLREGTAETLRRYNQQTSLITLGEREREVMQLRYSIEESALQQINTLKERQKELSQENTAEARAQIGVINEVIASIQAQASVEIPAIQEAVRLRMLANEQLERTQELEQLRTTVQQEVANANERIAQSQNEVNRASLEGLEGIQRKLKEIELEEREIASAARRRVLAQNENLDASSIKEAMQEIEAATNQAIQQRQAAAQATEERIEQIRREQNTFANGWKRAYKQYAEDASNAANQAERVFNTVTKNMEDAIVGFAKTGKFEFRDFANVVLEELLRIQIQRTFANLMGGGSGGQSGGGSLFGGFFATGGMIPPGRFGVVGESGPELVQGPANVTPMGSTQVTYNINAVDARSFKEMVASDPQFLYAVTEQGRSRTPGSRR